MRPTRATRHHSYIWTQLLTGSSPLFSLLTREWESLLKVENLEEIADKTDY